MKVLAIYQRQEQCPLSRHTVVFDSVCDGVFRRSDRVEVYIMHIWQGEGSISTQFTTLPPSELTELGDSVDMQMLSPLAQASIAQMCN